jgi:hypothetical protein
MHILSMVIFSFSLFARRKKSKKVVSSNPVHGEVYSIQHYVVKFVSYLRQVVGFFPDIPVSSINKTDRYDITEILLKVSSNTININP